jgi:hypothetical protein
MNFYPLTDHKRYLTDFDRGGLYFSNKVLSRPEKRGTIPIFVSIKMGLSPLSRFFNSVKSSSHRIPYKPKKG